MVFLSLLCLGCEDKADEATVVLDQFNLQFPPEGGTKTVNIECPMEWDILKMYDNDGLEVSALHGTGNQQVSITLQPNTYKVAKQRLLAIRAANGVTKQLFVSQQGKNGTEELFDVTPSYSYVSGEAGIVTSSYLLCSTPRCFWSLNGNAPWLEVSTDDGKTWKSGAGQIVSQYKEGVNVLFRTISNNEDERDRDATLVSVPVGFSVVTLASFIPCYLLKTCHFHQLPRHKSRSGKSILLSTICVCSGPVCCQTPSISSMWGLSTKKETLSSHAVLLPRRAARTQQLLPSAT